MGLRVLVVDDASFVRDMVKRCVRKLVPDAEIVDANDGTRAVGLMKTQSFDLILSDWEMPQMSGEEFLRWVREQKRHKDTPFIMVSSRGDRNHVVQAVQAGVSDYLSKPFSADELSRKIIKQLKRKGHSLKAKSSGSAQAQGTAFSSVDVLTGGQSARAEKKAPEVRTSSLFKPEPAQKQAQKAPSSSNAFDGKAQLRFPDWACECKVQDVSLQAMNIVIPRGDKLPVVFEQAVIDMENQQGEAIARLNAYVHSVQAVDPRPSSDQLKVTVRFVDNDPAKFEVLSKMIS